MAIMAIRMWQLWCAMVENFKRSFYLWLGCVSDGESRANWLAMVIVQVHLRANGMQPMDRIVDGTGSMDQTTYRSAQTISNWIESEAGAHYFPSQWRQTSSCSKDKSPAPSTRSSSSFWRPGQAKPGQAKPSQQRRHRRGAWLRQQMSFEKGA